MEESNISQLQTLNNDILVYIIDQVTDIITLVNLFRINKFVNIQAKKRFKLLYKFSISIVNNSIKIYISRSILINYITLSGTNSRWYKIFMKIKYRKCEYKHSIPRYRIISYCYEDERLSYSSITPTAYVPSEDTNKRIVYQDDSETQIVNRKDKLELFDFYKHRCLLPNLPSFDAYLINSNKIVSRTEKGSCFQYDEGQRLISRKYLVKSGAGLDVYDPFSGRLLGYYRISDDEVVIRKVCFDIKNGQLTSFYTWKENNMKKHDGCGSHKINANDGYIEEDEYNYICNDFTCFCVKCKETGKGERLLFLITSHRMFLPLIDIVHETQKHLLGCYARKQTHCYRCHKKLGKASVTIGEERWHIKCYNKVNKVKNK